MSENNPHDSFFKEVLTKKENAISFFQNYLPKEILNELDLPSLELQKGSFVDEKLKDSFSDLLFTVNLKNKKQVYIYTLFEHKSFPDKYTSLQLLKYTVRIWEAYLERHKQKGKLPIVVPIVIYHGSRNWVYGNELKNIQESVEILDKYQPNFTYMLYDLSKYTDEELKGNAELWVLLYLLKNVYSSNIEEKLFDFFRVLREIEGEQEGIKCIRLALTYLVNAVEKLTETKLEKILEETETIGVKTMPTIAQTWERRGYDKAYELVIKERRAKERALLEKAKIEKEKAKIEARERAEREKAKAEKEKAKVEKEKAKAEREKAKVEREKAKAEREKAKAKVKRAERKTKLKTAISMRKNKVELSLISKVLGFKKAYLERLFKKIGL